MHKDSNGKPNYDHLSFSSFTFDNHVADVTILDNDCPGEFSFSQHEIPVLITNDKLDIEIIRRNGIDGQVRVVFSIMPWHDQALEQVQFHIQEQTQGNVDGDKVVFSDEILFLDQQRMASVSLPMKQLEAALVQPAPRLGYRNPTPDAGAKEVEDERYLIQLHLIESPEDGTTYGPIPSAKIIVSQDPQFSSFVDEMTERMKAELETYKIGSNSGTWSEQFKKALTCISSSSEDLETEPTNLDFGLHFITLGWKVVFACVPPTDIGGGWLTFICSLVVIGILTAIVADVAKIFGCLLGLPDSVTAISFVALGTSLPDMFASRSAAGQDEHADASVGNVTGSNAVNVFLGLGLPWCIATLVHGFTGYDNGIYRVEAGDLAFSIAVFCPCACACLVLLILRRKFLCGAELGGPPLLAKTSAGFLFALWFLYVFLSSLVSTGNLKNPFL